MNLTDPTAHADAYVWAAVLLAHASIGLALTALVAAVIKALADDMIDGEGPLAWALVVIAYAVIWEGAVQALGAGVMDALVDTAAVALGGLLGLTAWLRKGGAMAVALAALGVMMFLGVRRR
jgi:ABC-type uncharacterized transport system permease subunit